MDRFAGLARTSGLDGPLLRVGDRSARIFWRSRREGEAEYGFELFHIAFQRNWKSDTVWGVSLWIPYLAIPLGFGLFVLQLAADLFAVATGKADG